MSQRWFITGSSRGLGRALSEAVLNAGHRLVASAREPARLSDLEERYGDAVRTAALDVTDPVAAEAAMRIAIDNFGGIDVLVNNAGYGNINSVEDTDLDDFRRQIETNLFGTIIVTKAAIPLMRKQHAGHIIQFSSVGGRIGAPGRASYSAAKWGVEGFSEVLAREMELIGVKVTIIEPGGFRTDFAGSSTQLSEGRPEYEAVVGRAASMQRELNGRQPGDPARAAQVILEVAAMGKPPLRLPLGSDALAAIEQADRAKLEELEHWRALSVSTDYPRAQV
ncbi:oxidoreductase [Phyllobacterium bourgognense]|uniref:NADP-dependent 3-hydroxy acid dehydrogenase YdfG n=1 Tax=Phyllobacterium bourgognense TaxID=314236 RepID=A0A368Z8R8_9HYPH|nr:oxidoreductase [Phyllobacterium bourgognense]RCW87896.1 NADP-dependent 3-hydroxy acid dehydrogenase YdfG [Phyllobacterium bourgognense]